MFLRGALCRRFFVSPYLLCFYPLFSYTLYYFCNRKYKKVEERNREIENSTNGESAFLHFPYSFVYALAGFAHGMGRCGKIDSVQTRWIDAGKNFCEADFRNF